MDPNKGYNSDMKNITAAIPPELGATAGRAGCSVFLPHAETLPIGWRPPAASCRPGPGRRADAAPVAARGPSGEHLGAW